MWGTERMSMATVSDYLDWRGDIAFSTDPFNEVDNVLLSLFSYVDLEGVLKEGEALPIREVCRRYFEVHETEEILARDSYVKLTPFLMDRASETGRFSGTILHHYVNIIDTDADEQMSAVTFDLDDGSSYVAYRGTDGSIVGWREDFNLSWLKRTKGQKHAVEYLNKIGSLKNRPLHVGGHSKGGNLAVYAAAFCDESVRNRVMEIYTNDGPGFMKEVARSGELKRIQPKICSIIPEAALFGLLMYGDYEHTIIKSSAKGILQHDAQTWQVRGNRFVRADGLVDTSILMDKILTDWIADVDPEQRKRFVDYLFDVLETPGADSFAQLKQNRIRNLVELFRISRGMDKERRRQAFEVLSVLAKTGKGALIEELKKKITENSNAVSSEENSGADL